MGAANIQKRYKSSHSGVNTCAAAGAAEDDQSSTFASTWNHIEAHGLPSGRRHAIHGAVDPNGLPLQHMFR